MKRVTLRSGEFSAYQWPEGSAVSREARITLPEFIKTLLDTGKAWYCSQSGGVGFTIAQGGLLSVRPLDWIIYHHEALLVLSPAQFSLLFTFSEPSDASPVSTPE